MSYVALYRKFRPRTFDEVRGQEPIVRALKNQMRADRLGHAYLFCGTRGTGKTTVAKILAQAVNCEDPQDGSPCGKCALCRSIQSGRSLNVVEIDAASNTGVDNVRQIIDEVAYPPTEGRFRVYIIDEVHMITNQAFNALLKTLEEPPAHVIFILATTEAHKIPLTILSRVQRYDFRRISMTDIQSRMEELLAAEGADAEPEALAHIARAADGSMRDALSLLDQCLAFFMDETLTYDKVLSVLGAADTEIFERMLSFVRRGDAAGAVSIVEETVFQGREPGQFVTDFLWYLRNLLMMKAGSDVEGLVDLSSKDRERLAIAAADVEEEVLMRLIRVLSELSDQLRYAAQKRVLLEVAAVRLCCPRMDTDNGALLQRVEQLEQELAGGRFATAWDAAAEGLSNHDSSAENGLKTPAQGASKGQSAAAVKAEKIPLPDAIPEEVSEVLSRWDEVLAALKPGVLWAVLRGTEEEAVPPVISVDPDGTLLVVYDPRDRTAVMNFESRVRPRDGLEKELEEAVECVLKKRVRVRIRKNESGVPKEQIYESALDRFAKRAGILLEEADF